MSNESDAEVGKLRKLFEAKVPNITRYDRHVFSTVYKSYDTQNMFEAFVIGFELGKKKEGTKP